MQRFYHSFASNYLSKYRLIVIFVAILAFFAIYMGPLLTYLPLAVSVGRDFAFDGKSVRQEDERTNALILGLGGHKNEPSGLTDTLLFASYDHANKKILMVSLPRDIWIPEMRAKINTAYYYGNQQDGLGLEWARRYVSGIIGEPIQYVVVVSFDGLIRLVDLVGGIEVNIESAFIDENYPVTGRENDACGGDPKTLCRYETIKFETGTHHFDGEIALKFARSRKSEGDEGSDFARSRRQQQIILSLKEKLLSLGYILNPKAIVDTLKIIDNSIESDIPESHIGGLAKIFLNAKDAPVRSVVLGDIFIPGKKDGFLINPAISPLYDNQYVLVPRADTWQPVQSWIDCLILGGDCPLEDFTKEIKD